MIWTRWYQSSRDPQKTLFTILPNGYLYGSYYLSPRNISLVRFCVLLWGQGGNWCLVFISMVALVLKQCRGVWGEVSHGFFPLVWWKPSLVIIFYGFKKIWILLKAVFSFHCFDFFLCVYVFIVCVHVLGKKCFPWKKKNSLSKNWKMFYWLGLVTIGQ